MEWPPPSPPSRCPRCGGQVDRWGAYDDISCLQCGWVWYVIPASILENVEERNTPTNRRGRKRGSAPKVGGIWL